MYVFNKKQGELYSKSRIEGTGYLAYRDIEYFSKEICKCDFNHVLDLGCGSGRSTRFLLEFCNSITGLDIDKEIINSLSSQCDVNYYTINNPLDNSPYYGAPYSLIFSILTVFHMENRNEISILANKIYNSLLSNGKVILVIGNKYLYSKNYSSVKSLVKNEKVISGNKYKIELKNIGCQVIDTYWDRNTISEIFRNENLNLIAMHKPLGSKSDDNPLSYQDEMYYPPYSYLAFEKQ